GGELEGQLSGQVAQRGLAHAVTADAGCGPQRGHRGHVDHRAAGAAHGRVAHLLGPAEGADHVDLEDLPYDLGGLLDQRPEHRVGADVVDQVVDAAVGVHGPAYRLHLVGLVV